MVTPMVTPMVAMVTSFFPKAPQTIATIARP
jgi:hypothetical protein